MEETGGSELEAVKKYFDTAGFERWNKIYGETDEVNKVGGGWRDRGPQQLGETAHRHPSRSLAFQPGPGVLNVGISDKRALPRPPAPPPPPPCVLCCGAGADGHPERPRPDGGQGPALGGRG